MGLALLLASILTACGDSDETQMFASPSESHWEVVSVEGFSDDIVRPGSFVLFERAIDGELRLVAWNGTGGLVAAVEWAEDTIRLSRDANGQFGGPGGVPPADGSSGDYISVFSPSRTLSYDFQGDSMTIVDSTGRRVHLEPWVEGTTSRPVVVAE